MAIDFPERLMMKINQDYIEWEVLRKILEEHQWVFMERCPIAYYSLCDDIYNNVKTPVNNLTFLNKMVHRF